MEHTAISALLLKVAADPHGRALGFPYVPETIQGSGGAQKIATLSLTAVVIGAWVAAWLFDHYGVDDIYLVVVAAAAVAVVIWQRD